jgi:hypothetical protein
LEAFDDCLYVRRNKQVDVQLLLYSECRITHKQSKQQQLRRENCEEEKRIESSRVEEVN